MKKLLALLPLLLLSVVGFTAVGCSDDDKDEIINFEQLPAQAKTFVKTYYPSVNILRTEKDKNEYEVTLADGSRIDFNHAGEWTDVDAVAGKTIPSGFYPAEIDAYVSLQYNGVGINEISKEAAGYEVDLVNGVDLHFNAKGDFVRVDRD